MTLEKRNGRPGEGQPLVAEAVLAAWATRIQIRPSFYNNPDHFQPSLGLAGRENRQRLARETPAHYWGDCRTWAPWLRSARAGQRTLQRPEESSVSASVLLGGVRASSPRRTRRWAGQVFLRECTALPTSRSGAQRCRTNMGQLMNNDGRIKTVSCSNRSGNERGKRSHEVAGLISSERWQMWNWHPTRMWNIAPSMRDTISIDGKTVAVFG